jgi:hypothetical protein
MRPVGHQPGLLLPAVPGERGEPGANAAIGRAAFGASGLWPSAADGAAATGGANGQPQAARAAVAGDGPGSVVSSALVEPGGRRTRHLSVSAEGLGGHRTGSGVVRGHYLCGDGQRIYVFGGSDGLVEPLCAGVGLEQHPGGRLLHSGVGAGVGPRATGAADLEPRPGQPIHPSGLQRCGGVGGGWK